MGPYHLEGQKKLHINNRFLEINGYAIIHRIRSGQFSLQWNSQNATATVFA